MAGGKGVVSLSCGGGGVLARRRHCSDEVLRRCQRLALPLIDGNAASSLSLPALGLACLYRELELSFYKEEVGSVEAVAKSVEYVGCCVGWLRGFCQRKNRFADTPTIKRWLDTPSAWKSPWILNAFLPGADMAYEDIRFFLSPAERSYDALGLMKQVSEQCAPVIADAEEILSNGAKKLDFDIVKSNNHNSSQEQENLPPMPSYNVAEGRVLDFSGCTTPNEKTRNMKEKDASKTSLITSPTSHLLRGYR